jgi:hypothetical protein
MQRATKRCILPAMTACRLGVLSGEDAEQFLPETCPRPFLHICLCFKTGCGRVYLPVSPDRDSMSVCTSLNGMSSLGFLARLSPLPSGGLWPSFPVTEVRRAAAVHEVPGSHVPTLYLLPVLLSGQGQAAAKSCEAFGPKTGPHTRHPQTRSVFWNGQMPIQSQTPQCHRLPVSLERGPLDSTRPWRTACGRLDDASLLLLLLFFACMSDIARRDGPTTSSRRNPHRAPDGKTFHLICLSRKEGDQVLPLRQRHTGMMIFASVSLSLSLSALLPPSIFLDLPLPPFFSLGSPLQRRDGGGLA